MASRNNTSFIEAFLQDAIDVRRSKGVVHLVPYFFIGCYGVGAGAAYFFAPQFFTEGKWDVAATVYSGVLAFNALTLALSWFAIGRVLEIISNPGFSSFLKSNGMLSKYSFYCSFIHLTQVLAATVTFFSLLLLFIQSIPIWGQQMALAAVVGSTLYALKWSLGAVRIASDLIVHFATYDGLDKSQKQALRVAVNNSEVAG